MATYYIDTCIWRDFAENRTDRTRDLGVFAKRFLHLALDRGDHVVWSKVVGEEMKFSPNVSAIDTMIREFSSVKRLLVVNPTSEQSEEALRLSQERDLPLGDAIHAVLARDTQATLITRDAHFRELRDIITCCAPEELIWEHPDRYRAP